MVGDSAADHDWAEGAHCRRHNRCCTRSAASAAPSRGMSLQESTTCSRASIDMRRNVSRRRVRPDRVTRGRDAVSTTSPSRLSLLRATSARAGHCRCPCIGAAAIATAPDGSEKDDSRTRTSARPARHPAGMTSPRAPLPARVATVPADVVDAAGLGARAAELAAQQLVNHRGPLPKRSHWERKFPTVPSGPGTVFR
jgi:hypothetical protein